MLAARIQKIGESEGTHVVARHLNRLTDDTSWKQATGTALVGRLVDATLNTLAVVAVRVARVRFPAVGLPDGGPLALHHHPTTAPGGPAPTEAAVPAH